MPVNKIKKEDNPDLFEMFIDDGYDESYKEHRRGSSFYVKTIHQINEEWFPNHPELWGFWETNQYIWDDNYGRERDEIVELNRVCKQEKIIKTMEWVQVEPEQDNEEEFPNI